jgi:hypothetical protein
LKPITGMPAAVAFRIAGVSAAGDGTETSSASGLAFTAFSIRTDCRVGSPSDV